MPGVWILAEQKDGNLKKVAAQLLTGAAELASKTGEEVAAVVVGEKVEGAAGELKKFPGVKKVFQVEGAALKYYGAEPYVAAIADLVEKNKPSILLGAASAQGKDLLPRLATRLKTAVVSDATEIRLDGGKLLVKRPIYSGKVFLEVEMPEASPKMVAVRPNTLKPAAPGAGSAEVVKVPFQADVGSFKGKVKEVIKGESEKIDLTEASYIVSGGRAMKAAENFKILWELAEVLGPECTVGASRAAVDSGYAPHSMQVGQTGKTVNPNLYIACGISGAIQHLAGMRTSKVIVAVNKDPDAPIFQKADYGVVGDLYKIVPLLTQEFKKLLSE